MERKKKILMIYPEIPPTYWSFKYALPFIGRKASIPPLGLLTVAGMLSRDKYEIKLVDMNVHPLTDEMILWADMVFISAMIVQKESFQEVVNRCKLLSKKVIAGGPYPSSSYKKIQFVDHFVLNEAEITLPKFLTDWEKGEAKEVYQSEKGERPDIATTPKPRFDLINIFDYNSMALQYSRGCPKNCEFCDIIEMFGHKVRVKTNEQFINELDLLYSLGWQGSVFIVDDNFIGNKKKIKELLPKIAVWQKARGYPFELFTEASIDLADDENLLDLMVAAGFNMVFIGIETPEEETLLKIGKKQNVKRDIIADVIKIQNKGIEVAGGFIIGFDNDPSDIFERHIQFIQKSGIVLAMEGLLTALPNTQFYRRLKQEDRLLEDSTGNNTHDLHLNFTPKMDLKIIIEGYKFIISCIYNPKAYFERCLVFLRNVHPHDHSVRRVRGKEIVAFFKSLIFQTFSSYGHYYLCYLVKALKIEPRMFPEAIRQSIMGYHFFKITNEILAVDGFKTYVERIKVLYRENLKNYSERIQFSYPNDISQKITEMKRLKKKLMRKAEKRCCKINEDFRHLVEEYLRNLENYLNTCYNQWLEAVG